MWLMENKNEIINLKDLQAEITTTEYKLKNYNAIYGIQLTKKNRVDEIT